MKNKSYLLFLITLVVMFLSTLVWQVRPAQADTVDGNVFLQGTYAEIGIGPNGTFGSLVAAPAGFHPHIYDDRLGFVADYQKDGWGVSDPPYGGDYFVPGSPWEGFGIECTGGSAQNGGGSATGDISPVSLTEGSGLTADWVGTVSICGSTLTVTHHYYMNADWTYMKVDTTIANTGGSPVTALTFGRGVDPDNDQTWPLGSFTTKNEVTNQPGSIPDPSNTKAIVTAWAIGYPDMGLILGTDDTRARANASLPSFGIYNSQTLTAPVIGPVTDDTAMQIAFDLGTLNAGASTTVTYFYGFNAPDLGVPGNDPPTITTILPNNGPDIGGTSVVITGTNFTGATVTFGGVAATCIVDSDTQITCTTPSHPIGAVDVVVTTAGGIDTSVGGFTYTGTFPEAPISDPPDGAVLIEPGPTQIMVTFSEDVNHVSSANPNSATNPANFLLVEDGANGAFNTISCVGGVLVDDTPITVNSVLYNASTFSATLSVNGSVPLPVGNYRLFACGTTSIYDPPGNRLNNGVDSIFNFSVQTAPLALPATGFAMDRVTALPVQTVSYTSLGDLWLEIPKLGVQISIVGIPQTNGAWDVSWLGQDAGWLNGSAFPTWAGNSVLTGHVWNADNTPGPFRSINTLWWGDKLIVHALDTQYIYEVRSVKQVGPGSTAAMLKHEDLPWITLVTCRGYDEVLNSYKYRVLVRAVLVEVK